MAPADSRRIALEHELAAARAERDDAQEALRAILAGEVDTVVVPGPAGRQLFSRQGAERPYRVLVETMSEGAVILIDGVIVYGNNRFAQMLGVALDEIAGTPCSRFVVPAQHPALDALLANAATSPRQARLTIARADGTEVPAQIGASSIDLEGRQALCLVVSDISELLEGEAAKRLGAYNRSLIDASPDPLLVLDALGHVTDVNIATETITGLSRTELIGQRYPFPEWVTQGSEFDIRHRDGHITPVLYSAADYIDDGGNAAGVLISLRDITLRRQSEAALRQSEEQFRNLVETTSDWIWETDADDRLVYSSPKSMELIGYDEAQILGKRPIDLAVPEERERVAEVIRERHGSPKRLTRFESTLAARDGRRVIVEVEAVPLFDPQGAYVGNRGIARDITERKRAEAEIRQGEDLVRLLLNSTAEGIYGVDLDGRCTFANAACLRTLGYDDAASLVGTNIHALIHHTRADGRCYPWTECPVEETLRTGMSVHREDEPLWRSDGASLTSEYWSYPLRKNGDMVGAVATFIDISERQHAAAAMRLQSAALNAAANAIVIADHTGTIVWTNQAFTALSGYSAEECVGKNQRDLVKSGMHDAAFYKTLWDTIRAGQVWSGEITNRRKDGATYAEDMTITPVRNTGGDVTHFVAVKHDLTARKQLEAQFLQAQKMEIVGQLAGGIAHDFNNLLTVINGAAEFVATELRDVDPLRAEVQEIRSAGERAAALTRQLLAFSRKQVMTLDVMSLTALVANMEGMLRRLIGETITLEVAPVAGPASIKADAGQIEQVILNLVVNARDAMPGGGVITIGTEECAPGEGQGTEYGSIKPRPCVCLTIGDTGTGMDAATRARIFEPFFTTKAPGKGSGLGLATVYGIVAQSGGALDVDTAPGRGTTFRIYLPRVEDAIVHLPSPAVIGPARPVTETVLVVEDEDGVRHMARRMLEKTGYRVLTAASGAEALLLLKRDEAIHLMFTDVVMPGMNGPELAAQAAAIRPLMHILYTSGYTDDVALRQSVLETTHFVGKPYTKEELARKVRESLDAGPTGANTPVAPAA